MSDWLEVCEVVSGLVLEGKLSPKLVRPESFLPPYDMLIRHIQSGVVEPDELIEKVGVKVVNTAYHAAGDLNGLGEQTDWVALLERSALRFDAGSQLEHYGRKLKRGEDVDLGRISELIHATEIEDDYGVVSATNVKREPTPFIPSGWEGIDEHLGGLPMAGLVSIGGPPGTGKTTFLLQLAGKFVRFYEEKSVLIFTLEMLNEELRTRLRTVSPSMTKEEASRVRLYDRTDISLSKMRVIAEKEKPGLMAIDFADLLISGAVDTSSMEEIYRHLAKMAKDHRMPTLLLGQLNGDYRGGIPRPHHLRWTRLAEALSWMQLMVYNPTRDHFPSFDEDDDLLPPRSGHAYIVAWKIRGGNRRHNGPGALQVRFRGDLGFAKNGDWFTLVKH